MSTLLELVHERVAIG